MGIAAVPKAEPPKPDDLVQAVVRAQEELGRAAATGAMQRDPYRFVLGGLSATLGLFPGLVSRMEEAAEDARVPFSAEEKAGFRRDVRDGLRLEAGKLAKAINQRTALLAGATLAVAVLAGGAGGFWLGRSSIREDVTALEARLTLNPGVARAWLELMRANPDPRPAIAAAATWQDPATQRRAGDFRLWMDQAPATAPPRR